MPESILLIFSTLRHTSTNRMGFNWDSQHTSPYSCPHPVFSFPSVVAVLADTCGVPFLFRVPSGNPNALPIKGIYTLKLFLDYWIYLWTLIIFPFTILVWATIQLETLLCAHTHTHTHLIFITNYFEAWCAVSFFSGSCTSRCCTSSFCSAPYV